MQATLWDAAGTITTSTRAAALASIAPLADNKRKQVFELVVASGERGKTDEEIGDALQMSGNTVRPRRRELVLSGRLMDSGRTRPTKSGRQSIVWIAASQPLT